MLKSLIKQIKNESNSFHPDTKSASVKCLPEFLNDLNYIHIPSEKYEVPLKGDVENFRLPTPVPSVYIIANVIPPSVEVDILFNIAIGHRLRAVKLKGRSTQVWGGVVKESGLDCVEGLPEYLESIVGFICDLGIFPDVKRPNHILINEYELGCGILPHKDGPLYHPIVCILSLGAPAIFSFSLPLTGVGGLSDVPDGENKMVASLQQLQSGREVKVEKEIGKREADPLFSVYVPPRSLLIFKDEAYTQMLHGIPSGFHPLSSVNVVNPEMIVEGGDNEAAYRSSITIRLVPHKEIEH